MSKTKTEIAGREYTKGLRCYIFKSSLGDCSNHGVSSCCSEVTVVGPGIPEIFEPTDKAPECRLVKRTIMGTEYLHIEPVAQPPDGHTSYMAGGCYVHTTDGRFPSKYPLSLHDRSETWAQYEALSR